jgi:hypothetical protein
MAFQHVVLDERDQVLAEAMTLLPREYVLADGSRFTLEDEVVWCHRCRDFVSAEKFPYRPGTDEYLDDLMSKIPEFDRRVRNDLREKAWLLERKSPPRCLRCGGQNLARFSGPHLTMKHPLDGRAVRLQVRAHCQVGGRVVEFDGDGVRM